MSRNIEIKARIDDLQSTLQAVAKLADRGPDEIFQDDTFFTCEAGRLKLRKFNPSNGELIFYQRANSTGPKESFYLISSTSEPDELRELLSAAYRTVGRVEKHRTLFMKGRTRIHVDDVRGLGSFIELEVVLSEGEDNEIGVSEANLILAQLDIKPEQLLEHAYVDLLQQ